MAPTSAHACALYRDDELPAIGKSNSGSRHDSD
jgi:hypothetical protein